MQPNRPTPAVVAVCGAKNSGKTTLIERLLPLLCARGLRVAVIKHDGHAFQPDRPGTDTRRFYDAGAQGTAVFDGEKLQLVRRGPPDVETMVALFGDLDLLLLEGFKHSRWPKLELLRAGDPPLSAPAGRLALVVERLRPDLPPPQFLRDDVAAVAELLVQRLRGERR